MHDCDVLIGMAQLADKMSCHFAGIYDKCCEGPVVALNECNSDISKHRSFLRISAGPNFTEAQLIKSRAVTLKDSAVSLTAADHELDEILVCKIHRQELGVHWRRFKRTCEYPGHQGATKPTRHLNFEMFGEMQAMSSFDSLPIGARTYQVCKYSLGADELTWRGGAVAFFLLFRAVK